MPCNDGRDNVHVVTEYREDPEMKKRRHKLARMLCETIGKMSATQRSTLLSLETRQWYKEHREEDRRREEREKAVRNQKAKIRKAVAKLTPEERKLLGISTK